MTVPEGVRDALAYKFAEDVRELLMREPQFIQATVTASWDGVA